MPVIPFGEWTPDLPSTQSGATVANNVVPAARSYRPLAGLAAFTAALEERAQGAAAFVNEADGTVRNVAGDAARLYRLNGTAWVDATRAVGGAYGTAADGRWEFAKFGPLVVAANGVDDLQAFDVASGSRFDVLAGSPPVARHLWVANNFLVAGDIAGSRQRVQWSAIDDATSWTVSAATQADWQDLVGDGGVVQRGFGYEQGAVVLQEHAVWRMDYAGPPTVFNFTKVDPSRGLLTPAAAAQAGTLVFFLAEDGFYAFDGQAMAPIGGEKVDRTFFADLDPAYVDRISMEVDPRNKLLFVSYPGAGSSGGTPNRLLIYNWQVGRWSSADLACEILGRLLTSGYALEELDAFAASIDTLAFNLDSQVWAGGKQVLSAFTSDHALGYLTGAALAPTVDTMEMQLVPGQRAFVTEAWPLVEGGVPSVAPITRNRLGDDPVAGDTVAQNVVGFAPLSSEARFHRFRVTLPAGQAWDHLIGVEPVVASGGVL